MVPLFFVALVLGFLVLIKYSLWRDHFSRQFPGMKPGFFNVFGDSASVLMYCVSSNSLPFLYWVMQFLTERTEQFQEQQLFYLWTSYQPHFCFVKAESVKQLLSKGTKALEKNWAYDYLKPLMGTGLVTSSVEKWKPRRKLLTPCFHADVLRGFLPVFNERSRKLVEHLRQETEKEFTNIDIPVTLTALDVVYETMLGTSIGALEKNSAFYITAMNRISDISLSRIVKIWEYVDIIFNLTSGKEEKRQVKVIEDFTKSVIQEKKKQYLSGKKDNEKRKRKAFMDMLLELHFENQELSEEDICEEVNTFVAAGYETVSLTMSWALYLIGLYPDVQAKIHEELDRIFGSDVDRDVTESDLNDLKYLDCVLKETLRVYTVAPIIGRILQEDTNICGYTIPKGTNCFILIYSLHNDKEVFPDPEKFDPDRFLPENFAKIPEYGYIPFSAGPRNCIGQKFGLMEMKTVLSFILRNYTIESLDSRDKVLPVIQVTLHPSTHIRIRIKPRMSGLECSRASS